MVDKAKTPIIEGRYLSDIQRHIEKFVGTNSSVLHEFVSTLVHIDVHVVKPTAKLPYVTLLTSGMSDQDMNVPDAAVPKSDYELAEIVAFLPPDWPVEDFTSLTGAPDENPPGYYPIFWMKYYARKVHEQNVAMSWYSTSANGNPASPIGNDTEMTGFLLAPAILLDKDALFISTVDHRKIRLLNLVPIRSDEMSFAIKKGGMALCEKLSLPEKFVFDPKRASAVEGLVRKKFLGIF
jgi:Suppressor of fused protein (SUFU)